MLIGLVVLVAAVLTAAVLLVSQVRRLEERLQRLESRPGLPVPVPALPEPRLAGIRVAIRIEQDYPRPAFVDALTERLLEEGAVVGEPADVVVEGRIVGNGYSDVYFQADLTCRAGETTISRILETPPHGDRPANLVLEVVNRLASSLARADRRRAFEELGS